MDERLDHPLKFSLRHLFAMMTVLALGCFATMTFMRTMFDSSRVSDLDRRMQKLEFDHQQKIAKLERELDATTSLKFDLERYRGRGPTGDPQFIDPTRVASTYEWPADNAWNNRSFRIHRPAGRKLVLCGAIDHIEEVGLPPATFRMSLHDAEHTHDMAAMFQLSADLVKSKNSSSGPCFLRVTCGEATDAILLPPNHPLVNGSEVGTIYCFSQSHITGSDVPHVLMRIHRPSKQPSAGIVLWLEDE